MENLEWKMENFDIYDLRIAIYDIFQYRRLPRPFGPRKDEDQESVFICVHLRLIKLKKQSQC